MQCKQAQYARPINVENGDSAHYYGIVIMVSSRAIALKRR